MEPSKCCFNEEFNTMPAGWKKYSITKNQMSLNVTVVFDIGHLETLFQKSSDLVIYQYSIITVLPVNKYV